MIGDGKNRPELRSANHDISCEIQGGIKVLTILLPRSTSCCPHRALARLNLFTKSAVKLKP
jgi:hypothetical protein